MWMSKRRLHNYLAANNIDMLKALIKLIMYPYAPNMASLILEVHDSAYICPVSKGYSKLITSKFVYDCVAEDNSFIPSLIQICKEEMCISLQKPIDLHESYVIAAIEEYQHWLADQLSSQGIVTRKEVQEAITELLLQVMKVTSQVSK